MGEHSLFIVWGGGSLSHHMQAEFKDQICGKSVLHKTGPVKIRAEEHKPFPESYLVL